MGSKMVKTNRGTGGSELAMFVDWVAGRKRSSLKVKGVQDGWRGAQVKYGWKA